MRLDVLVEPDEPLPVAVNGEPGNGPQNLSEEVDHGADVVELDPEGLLPQIGHFQAGRLGAGDGVPCAPVLADLLRTHHEVGELAVGARAYLLRQVGAAGLQDPGDLLPEDVCGMPAHYQIERPGQKRQVSFVVRLDYPSSHAAQVPPGDVDVRPP